MALLKVTDEVRYQCALFCALTARFVLFFGPPEGRGNGHELPEGLAEEDTVEDALTLPEEADPEAEALRLPDTPDSDTTEAEIDPEAEKMPEEIPEGTGREALPDVDPDADIPSDAAEEEATEMDPDDADLDVESAEDGATDEELPRTILDDIAEDWADDDGREDETPGGADEDLTTEDTGLALELGFVVDIILDEVTGGLGDAEGRALVVVFPGGGFDAAGPGA
jgi:hypothetical protein